MYTEGDIVQLSKLSEVSDIFHLSALGLHPDRQYRVVMITPDNMVVVKDCVTNDQHTLPAEGFTQVVKERAAEEKQKAYLGAYVSKKLKSDVIHLSKALGLTTNRLMTHALQVLVEQARNGGILPYNKG